MKLKKESVKTLLLVLLWQAFICSANVAAPKYSRLEDILKDDGERALSRNLKATIEKTVKDPYSPEEISRTNRMFERSISGFFAKSMLQKSSRTSGCKGSISIGSVTSSSSTYTCGK